MAKPKKAEARPLAELKRELQEARDDARLQLGAWNYCGLADAMKREYALMMELVALLEPRIKVSGNAKKTAKNRLGI
jgi:hypothetical protein